MWARSIWVVWVSLACLACGDSDGDDDSNNGLIDAAAQSDANSALIDAAVIAPDAASLADAGPVELAEEAQFAVTNPCGLGFDDVANRVWVYQCGTATVQRFTVEGVAEGSVPSPGETADDADVDFAPAPLTLGGSEIPAGTMVFTNGESGVAELYVVDKDGVEAPTALATAFGASHVVGGAIHAARGTVFLVQDRQAGAVGNLVAELDAVTGAVVNSFSIAPDFSVNFGDIDVCQSSGNLFLVSSDETNVAEFTADGSFVGKYALPAGITRASGIGMENATGHAWVTGTAAVSKISGLPCAPGP